MAQSKAVRDRENRKSSNARHTEFLTGAMIDITTYNGKVRMFDVKAPVPSTAEFVGRLSDDLLPKGE